MQSAFRQPEVVSLAGCYISQGAVAVGEDFFFFSEAGENTQNHSKGLNGFVDTKG